MVGGKVRGKSKLLFLIVLVSILVLSSVNVCSLEVMTYNIKAGSNLNEVIEVIQKHKPDIIALQEVDVNTVRSGNVNQFEILKQKLGMNGYFSKAIDHDGGQYGIALLSKYPLSLIFAPSYKSQSGENRIYQQAKVNIDGNEVTIFNTHLIRSDSAVRKKQIDELYSVATKQTGPVIVMGDFNDQSSAMNNFKNTFISAFPQENTYKSEKIDYIFLSKSVFDSSPLVSEIEISPLTKSASDHFPISVDVGFNPVGSASSSPQTNSGNALTTDAGISKFDTMIILGRHIRSQMENRVRAGNDLINSGNFKKLILTGGCVAKTDGDATCATCSGSCNEATEMENYLLEINPNIKSKIQIVKESKSGDTVENLKNSKGLINPGEKVLVVSDHRHVKAVAYCLRYAYHFDTYYYFAPKESITNFNPFNAELIAPIKGQVEENKYGSMIPNCMASATPAPTSSQPTPPSSSPTPTSPMVAIPLPSMELFPRGLPKSEEEIDEVWIKLAPFVRPEYKDLIYVPNPNVSQQGTWENFEIHYYEYRAAPAGSTPSPGEVTPGSSGPSASSQPSIQQSTTPPPTGATAINQPGYGYSTTHGITADDINKAIYNNQLGRSKKTKYLGQMEAGLWVDVYTHNLGACLIKMEQEYSLPVAFPMSVMLRTGAIHTKVSGGNCQAYDSASSSGPFNNIFNTKRSKSSSGRQCFIPTTECYSDSKLKSASIQAKITEKGCTKIGKDAESKCKISINPHLNYCHIHDGFGGFDSPCQAIESWYKLIAQGSRYKECINAYRINNDLDQLIFCVPSKGYSTSQTWYGQVKSGAISFVNKWGKK